MPNTTIELRQSGSTGNTPSLGVLANGELAINRADGILYYKSASNTLGSIRTTQPAGLTTEVQFNDAGSFGSTSQVTINKVSGEFRATTIKSTQSSGDEGGQIDLATAATNSTLAGGYVNIDIYQNRLRIFEAGGTNRGVFIDMANSAAAGVGSDLLGGTALAQGAFNRANTANITADASFARANSANITADAAFARANTANITADAAFSRANAANVLAQSAFNQANISLANTGTSVIANGLTRYTFANSTPSTSTTTGTVVISGGLGVAGNIYASAVYDGGVEVISFAQAAFDKANSVTQQGFVTVAANGTNVVADANNDTLTLSAANGVGIFANATTDAITINLTPTGVTSGTYANATHVPVITVDTFGRLTSVSNTIIQSATTSQNGIVRLNDTITSTSTTQAGTANSVNNAYVTAVADALAFAVALG